LIKPKYKYNFRNRSFLYILIGFFCVYIDYFSFIQFSKVLDPIFANPICYSIGSTFSYLLNKKYTFRSQNSKLSLKRYIVIIFLGLSASQLVIFLGLRIFRLTDNISHIKFIGILAAVGIQYLCNTFFGSSKLRSDEFEKKRF
tara:strand:+ start:202 stop:630 length:429 start_codon:yes stop_codon:yes gene_type:complete